MPKTKTGIHREPKELLLLFELSQTLGRSMDLRDVAGRVLRSAAEHMGLLRGTLTLLNRKTGEILIEAAHGLSSSQMGRGRYKFGEGVTGKVVQTGRPVTVPDIAREPLFLDRTGARKKLREKEISFICVPIKLGKEVIGALSADRGMAPPNVLREDQRLLSIIASMIAQAVRLRQQAEEEREQLLEENIRLQEQLKGRFQPANIIGTSPAMRQVYDLIAKVAPSKSTVLIRGESGTGKELVASAIHYHSPRSAQPLIKVNCAALPETIIESELFGHDKGAFTGAAAERKGRFELARGGTLFLDEIGDLPPHIQVKLLRVLQEREFERVGGTKTLSVDVRLIAATNRNLEDLAGQDKFRQDLYYRLNVFPIHLPPLRERKPDILELANHFAETFSRENHKDIRRISTPAIDMLMAYHWPGNVRELENCIERAVLLSHDEVIHGHHLPPTLQTAEATGTVHRGGLQEALGNLEREVILDALKSARGNMARAARAIEITERQMGLRMKKYGIDYRQFRTKK